MPASGGLVPSAWGLGRAPAAGFLGEDREHDVIAPAPADLQISDRIAFLAPSGRAQQADRSLVAGLDVRLEPVQPELPEGEAEHEWHRGSHRSRAGMRHERVVPEEGVAERTAMDLG